MSAPMTPERRAEIRERAESVRTWKAVWGPPIPQLCDVDIPDLLDEVERAERGGKELGKVVVRLAELIKAAFVKGETDPAGALLMLGDHLAELFEDEGGLSTDDHNRIYRPLEQRRGEVERLRAELEDARVDRKTAEMQRDDYRTAHKAAVEESERLRAELDDTVGEARSDIAGLESLARRYRTAWESARRGRLEARAQIKTARPYIDWLHEQRRALFGRVAEVEAELGKAREQVRVLAGLLKRGNPKVFCAQHPNHAEPGCEVCRDAGIFRSALDEQDGDA